MPIYEYVCLDCGERFEALRAMKDADAPISCEQCASDHTSRLLAVLFAQGSSPSGSDFSYASSNGGGCAGCSGGSCSTCGR